MPTKDCDELDKIYIDGKEYAVDDLLVDTDLQLTGELSGGVPHSEKIKGSFSGKWQILEPINNIFVDDVIEIGAELPTFSYSCREYDKSRRKFKGKRKKKEIKTMHISFRYSIFDFLKSKSNNWLKRHGYPMRRKTYEQRNKYK